MIVQTGGKMADIKPFRAIRPRADMVDQIAALPYDVYSRKEAYEKVRGDVCSFLRIDRPETQFPEEHDMYAYEVYEKAASMLQEMQSSGLLLQEETEAYYIYELVMNGHSQVGIGACVSVDDYERQVVKKHENTRTEKEADRIRHIDHCNAQTGPILLAYRRRERIEQVVREVMQTSPIYDFTAEDGVIHRLWIMDGTEQIKFIRQEFAQVEAIYIADGHHRCASAVRVSGMRRAKRPVCTGKEEFNYFLSVLFPDDQLMIMDYNRVVRDLNGYTEAAFIEAVSGICTVTVMGSKPFRPACKGQIGMYLKDTWYCLTVREDCYTGDPVEDLDVAILQREILEPLLGISDPRTDNRIDFVGGIRGLEELVKRVHADAAVAFAMYPTDIHELFAVADAGRLMPPKSTWFEPKLRSGILIHKIEGEQGGVL